MTVLADPDVRGVVALSGDNVLVAPYVFLQLGGDWEDRLDALPNVEFVYQAGLGFDEAPWLAQRDQIDHLELVVSVLVPLDSMIYKLAIATHKGDDDLTQYLMEQWRLAEAELAVAEDGGTDGGIVAGAVEEDGSVGAADPGGGGGDFPGGSEDDRPVGVGEEAAVAKDAGRPSKISGQRRRGKAGRGGSIDAASGAQDSPAA